MNKKYSILAFFTAFTAIAALESCKSSQTSKTVASTAMKTSVPPFLPASKTDYYKGDTLVTEVYDTLLTITDYNFGYVRDQKMVDFFTPHLFKDLCNPGDYNHPVYVEFMRKGAALKEAALNDIKKQLPRDPLMREELLTQLKSLDELNECELRQLTVYAISPNIVLYNGENNISRFFTLDTSRITYRILKGPRLIGFLHNRKGYNTVSVISVPPSEAILSYNKVMSLNKEPIGIINDLKLLNSQGPELLDFFGYVKSDRVMYALYSYGNLTHHSNTAPPVHVTYQEWRVESLDVLFNKGGSYPRIKQILDSRYKPMTR